MNNPIFVELENYIDFDFDRNPLSFEELDCLLLATNQYKDFNYREKEKEVDYINKMVERYLVEFLKSECRKYKWYDNIEANSGKTWGELRAEAEQSFIQWRKALPSAYEFNFIEKNECNEPEIKMHYRANNYKRIVKINHLIIIEELSKFSKWGMMDIKTIIEPNKVEEIKSKLLGAIERFEFSEPFGKYGSEKSTHNKAFLKSTYPYFRFLHERKMKRYSNEDIYKHILKTLDIEGVQTATLREYYSEKENPPQKVTL